VDISATPNSVDPRNDLCPSNFRLRPNSTLARASGCFLLTYCLDFTHGVNPGVTVNAAFNRFGELMNDIDRL
jgi:hypothetical protein